MAQPVDHEHAPRLGFPVVAIGASAGGLEAFSAFLQSMPCDSGMAFVLIQHLPPEHESLMAEILGKRTSMPVNEVDDGMEVEPDHVYVIRPGRTMTIRGGKLHLGEPLERPGHRRPVDDFFRSLAGEQRERAICIVMSGMGSNGSAGAQAVKAVGGLCIAQDPETAKFPVMPRSLIDAGFADFVLRPDEMPAALIAYAGHPYVRGEKGEAGGEGGSDEGARNGQRRALNEMLAVLRSRLRLDFSGYKKATLMRRVQRRMGLNQITGLDDYLRLLRQSQVEVTALGDDLLIHVTGFFRDSEAWEALREKVIEPLVAERAEDVPVRAWATACSSGEEAYTLAMLLVEAAEAAGKRFDIKVFATDTAERMLGMARNGVYPAGIESEITPERLARFFDHEDSVYRVKKELRELIVFAPQNVLQDPPFSRLDICTCRNLLIYLEPEMQQRLLGLLHFALREGGILLLGNSETVGDASELFEPIDKKHRLFRRVGPTRHGAVEFSLPHSLLHSVPASAEGPAHAPFRPSVAQQASRALLDRFSPPSVVVDRQQRIVYFHGQTERFLDQPRGEPTRELLALAREPIRGALRAALHKAIGDNAIATVRDGHLETAQGRRRIEIVAAPLDAQSLASHFLVSFQEIAEPPPATVDASIQAWDRRQLEEELQRVRDELQCTIEELQTSNEEMKASNEEVTSINEELQSTNEELETSKEELQSLNEELTTVNAQLQAKMEELEATTNDLSSLLSSTDIAVIFLDTRFRIRRFTPAVKDLLELIPSDVGRPLSDLALKFSDKQLLPDARTVLDKLVPLEREIVSDTGRVYVRRTLPYRTTDNRIDGVVITFIDITARQHAEEALRESEERHRLILEGIKDYAIIMLDESGRIATWSAGAARVFGYAAGEVLGQPVSLLMVQTGGEVEVEAAMLRRARTGGSTTEEGWHRRKDGQRFWASGMMAALRDGSGHLHGYVKVLRDYTERKQMEDDLRQAKHAAEAASEAKDHFLANVSHELRTPLSAIVLWTKLISENPELLGEGMAAMRRCAEELNELIEDLVDTARIEAGKLRLELRETALEPLVRGVVESMAPAARRKNLSLEHDLDARCGSALVDPHRMVQVVSNLLHNAVKFTPPGGRIHITLEREGDNAVLRVTDTGKGIGPESLPKVFERFWCMPDHPSGSEDGLGLGLSIARQVVELHGGTISAESEGPGKGASFTVRLNLLPESATAGGTVEGGAEDAAGGGKASLAGLHLFLVEDAADTRRALTVVLENAGARVRGFESASAALEAWAEARPDLLLSDLGLPGIDGFDLIRHVRERETESGVGPVPAVALTAYAGERIRQRALDGGYADCLTKPVEPAYLVLTLAAAHRGQRQP